MKKFDETNPEYVKYIHSTAWHEKTKKRLEMDRHVCQVCGCEAIDVHHLSYRRFKNEEMGDLVSLCRECHEMAEYIYSPTYNPWTIDEARRNGTGSFMAAMRVDAGRISNIVYSYLHKKYGTSFDKMMQLRQPVDAEGKKYWTVLEGTVKALCYKRYELYTDDRIEIALGAISTNVIEHCLSWILHSVRNEIQGDLHNIVLDQYETIGKWNKTAESLGTTTGTLNTLRKDDGSSIGPTLREEVMYYCALDAAHGIRPLEGFECLTEADYCKLNEMADYIWSISEGSDHK